MKEETMLNQVIIQGMLIVFALCANVQAQEAGSVGNYVSYTVHETRAVIGKRIDELRARFGHEQKSEPGWNGGTAYGFIAGGYYIYATIGSDGRVGDVFYAANQWPFRKLSAAEADRFFLDNEGGKTYDNFTYSGNYNQRHEFVKGYGVEKGFTHWVEYSWNGTTALISNYGPLDKPKAQRFGYQVRALDKFNADQKWLKAHFKT
jgi:hypothetical protein